jgi:F0F1-type ATP synthase membrane subunit b/b'
VILVIGAGVAGVLLGPATVSAVDAQGDDSIADAIDSAERQAAQAERLAKAAAQLNVFRASGAVIGLAVGVAVGGVGRYMSEKR